MHPELGKSIESAEFSQIFFENIKVLLYSFLIIIICLGIYLKYTWSRNNFMNAYPSRKFHLFDPFGNLGEFLFMTKDKNLHWHVYITQMIMGFCELFKNEDFFVFSMGYYKLIAVYKAKVVQELLYGSKNLQKHWVYGWLQHWLGTGLLTSNGSKWKSRRKLLAANFHTDILKEFMPVFNEQSKVLMGVLKEESKKDWSDIVKLMTLCSIDIVAESTLGIKTGAQLSKESEYAQAVIRAAESIVKRAYYIFHHIDWYFFLTKEGAQFKKDVNYIHKYTYSLISERKKQLEQIFREKEEEDTKKKEKTMRTLMDMLLEELIKNGSLDEEGVREELDTFTFEGHDTTTVGMSWCLYLLGLHKDVQDKVREEINFLFGKEERSVNTDDFKELDYLDRVMKETQRLYPSVPFILRTLEKDTEIGGKILPEGTGIVVLQYMLHRDETVFPNPEVFDPDRFLPENVVKRSPFAFLPFSTGSRNCIGQRFALMKEKVVLVHILRNYTVESLDPRDKVHPVPELILRPEKQLRIKFRHITSL